MILSDSSKRPKDWNYFLTIPDRKLAAKTWTSTKQYLDNKWSKDSEWKLYKKRIIFPRDMWTVWYTPQITTVVWAWNTSWKELKPKAYGINWAWPIMRDFMNFAHKWKEILDWKK
jgi:membrane peptidoglycan carboxypeptidase